MPLTTNTALGVKLTDATRRGFRLGYKDTPMAARAIFDVQMTEKKVETFNSAIMDRSAVPTGDGDNYAASNATLGDELSLTQAKYTDSFEVTEDQTQYDQYGIAAALAGGRGLGSSAADAIELYAQQLISQGAAASYADAAGNTVSCLAADGNPLFYDTHSVNGSSSTYDNVIATAFGQTGIEEALENFRGFLNQDGIRMNRRPRTIFSTGKASLVGLINEYLNSQGHPEDAFNGVNVYKGQFNHVVMEYLDASSARAADAAKDDYWGLVIAKDPNLKLRVSQEPTVHPMQIVQRNRNALFQVSTKFAVGVEDPSCILLSAA
jgi:hypothetical protein